MTATETAATHIDQRPWFERATRWAQVAFVDTDPAPDSGYDVGFWLDYFRRIRANAACISAGGYMAFYPTQIPGHHRSAHLGDRDPFGELVAGCRDLGMAVLGRTDPHAVHDDVRQEHPEWIAVDEHGQPRRHWAMPELWVTCVLGGYATEFMPQVNREIIERYDVDGIFSNRWAGSYTCYCDWCRTAYAEAVGGDIPTRTDTADPAARAYQGWRVDRLLEIARLWNDGIRALKPDASFVPNSGGGALSLFDMERLGSMVDMLVFDRQARKGTMPAWQNGQNARVFRAALGERPVSGMFCVGVEEPHRWKDSVQTQAEIRIWAASAIAGGARPWFIKFGATIADGRWLDAVEDLFTWHADIEPYLRGRESLAQVGIVYSQQTARMYGEHAADRVQGAIDGFYQALVEARVPIEMVHDRMFDASSLQRLRTLILPNVACLSDEQCSQLREFVAAGGCLVATHETSLYDEHGERRDGLGLEDVLGVRVTGEPRGPLRNSYLGIGDPDADPSHATIVRGLQDTSRVINGVRVLPVEPAADALGGPLLLIDTFPDLPMEELYRRETADGPPQVFTNRYGAGRAVYLAGDLDRTFAENLNADLGRILANVVEWANGGPPGLVVDGQGMVDVSWWAQPDAITVHLVNMTNPMTMRGPFRELIASPPQTVRVRLPEGRRPTRVQLLRRGVDVGFETHGDEVRVVVDAIEDIEVVAIDLD